MEVFESEVVVDVDVCKPIAEGVEELRGTVRLLGTAAEVGVPDVQMETSAGGRVEQRTKLIGGPERAAHVLDHQPDARYSCVLGERSDSLRVALHHLVRGNDARHRIRVDVDDLHSGFGKGREAAAKDLVSPFAQVLEGRRDR